MTRQYYFLASLLPELEIGHRPALDFSQLMELIRTNLTPKDQLVVYEFLRRIDFENFRAFWNKEEIDLHGNLSESEIEQSLAHQAWPNDEPFPSYLLTYLERYHDNKARASHFAELMSKYYEEQSESPYRFIAEYSRFQRELYLVMVGFRAKMIGRDLIHELQFEDPKDPIVAQIIAQKDAKTFEPPFEYKELKPIFEEFAKQPLDLYKAIYAYQFRQIVERWGSSLFSIERILNYLARLLLVEKWLELDVLKGMQIVDTVEGNVR